MGQTWRHMWTSKPQGDVYVVLLSREQGSSTPGTALASVYMHEVEQPPPHNMTKLVSHCEEENLQLLIATDSNAHHVLWGMDVCNDREVSEDSIDIAIPSFPGSPRSLGSRDTIIAKFENIEQVVDFLEHDDEFLTAAELGDENLLKQLIKKGVNINQKDHLERNALHLAVCTGNRRAVLVLLNAGVKVNVKSDVGMTPLSLCLMRRPSWRMANMLFDYGAKVLPRNTAMDTGLFLQFVMMCIPTKEEERILRLLIEKGAVVDDPQAPGGRQALHFAAMSNNCRLIKILLDLGANPLLTNHRNETPRQVAATYNCRDAQKLLAEWEESMLKHKQS